MLHALISKTLYNKKKLFVAFLDWEKMFDKIDRLLLWQKLLNNNVSSKFVLALRSMYTTVKSTVRYQNVKSESFNSYIGVKQGDPCSSLLCLFFLNDILQHIKSDIDGILTVDDMQLFLLLFADDAVVFTHDPKSLQSILNDIENYCNKYKLKINVNKTKIMICENGRHTSYDFYLYKTKIELVKSFKYLGVHLFKNGKWTQTQKRTAQHASFALHNLFTIFNQIELPITERLKLFDALVSTTLNYGAQIWGMHKSPDVETMHSKFCRKMLCVKKSTNLEALYGELGTIPMYIQRKIIMIKYWMKILSLNENSILFKTYKMLKTDAENGHTYNNNNWAYSIKQILDESGLILLWENQSNIKIELQPIKYYIIKTYYAKWYRTINNSPRLESYCLFKHSVALEKYLQVIKVPKYRTALARFRTSSHTLAIEQGRFTNNPRSTRICKNCHFNQIESEYHFLLICPKYTDLRVKNLKRYYFTWPTTQKFINLMSETCKTTISGLSRFIYEAMLIRT